MIRKLITLLGGFPDIESAIDAIREKNLEEKYTILTLAVRKLFNTLGPADILKVSDGGQWMSEGKTLNEGQKKLLIAEAINFTNTTLWKVLQADIKYQANRRMFNRSKTALDLVAGKLWLFTLDAINTRLKSLAKGDGSFNSK